MRRMLPMVWSSLSTVNDAALIIFVSLSYETLAKRKRINETKLVIERGRGRKILFGAFRDDESLITIRGIHGVKFFCLLLLWATLFVRAEQVLLVLLYKALATRTTRQATIRLGNKTTSLVKLRCIYFQKNIFSYFPNYSYPFFIFSLEYGFHKSHSLFITSLLIY